MHKQKFDESVQYVFVNAFQLTSSRGADQQKTKLRLTAISYL